MNESELINRVYSNLIRHQEEYQIIFEHQKNKPKKLGKKTYAEREYDIQLEYAQAMKDEQNRHQQALQEIHEEIMRQRIDLYRERDLEQTSLEQEGWALDGFFEEEE